MATSKIKMLECISITGVEKIVYKGITTPTSLIRDSSETFRELCYVQVN